MEILTGIPQEIKQRSVAVKDLVTTLEVDAYIEVNSIGYARNLKSDLGILLPDKVFTVWTENGKNYIGRIK